MRERGVRRDRLPAEQPPHAIPIEQPTLEDAGRYRTRVRDRVSQRNWLMAGVTVALAPIPLVLACAGTDGKEWTILLAGPVAGFLWHLWSGVRPRVICPNCGDNWEYDAFLKHGVCESCGLSLPREPRQEKPL